MKMQFLSPKHHGLLDYAAASGLIIFPFILDLGAESSVALWLSVVAGIGLIVYSLLTDYPYGVSPLIPYNAHLGFDLAAAFAFIAAPFVFSFSTVTSVYYIVMAVGVLLVVAASERPQSEETAKDTVVA